MGEQGFVAKCLLALSLMNKRRKLRNILLVVNDISIGKTTAPDFIRSEVWAILFATMVFGILLGAPVWFCAVGIITLFAYKLLPLFMRGMRPPNLITVLLCRLTAYKPQDVDAFNEMVAELQNASIEENSFNKVRIHELVKLKWAAKEKLAIMAAAPFRVCSLSLGADNRFKKAASKLFNEK